MNTLSPATIRPTILVVDDTPDAIGPIVDCLQGGGFRTRIATEGERALALARTEPQPDLILLDVVMPGMDGYEVCRRLKADPATAAIPVIFLTIRTEEGDEQNGFDAGAVDYIGKPINPPLVLTRVRTHLNLRSAAAFLQNRNSFLEEEVARRTQEINVIQDATIMAMASLAETRDSETGNHIRRTQRYVQILAENLKDHPRFRDILSNENIHLICKSAPLHDIGKVGIPDRILLKPGKLTPEEFEVIKEHPALGRDAILAAENLIGVSVPFLRFTKEIAYAHHEKWDGSGYPDGIAGDVIPISARLMAVADVYDALISRRIYKPALSHAQAVDIIHAGQGSHFDPDVVAAFLAQAEHFDTIARRFADTAKDGAVLARKLSQVFGFGAAPP